MVVVVVEEEEGGGGCLWPGGPCRGRYVHTPKRSRRGKVKREEEKQKGRTTENKSVN